MSARGQGQIPTADCIRFVVVDGVPSWNINGRILPVMRGGDGTGDQRETPGQMPPQGGQTPPTTPPPPPADPPKVFDADYVAELRKEASDNRKKAAALEAKLKEQDDAKLSETERLTKRTAELEQQLTGAQTAYRDALVRSEILSQAHAQGAVDADAVLALVDRTAIALGDDGTVTGAQKAVESLLKAKTYLVKQADPNGNRNVPPTPRPTGNGTTKEEMQAEATKKLQASGRYARL